MNIKFNLDSSQALVLVEAYRGIRSGGSGYEPTINSLVAKGLMQYDKNNYFGQITQEGKEFAKEYIESINTLILKELLQGDYRSSMSKISGLTHLSWGILEDLFIEKLVDNGKLERLSIDKDVFYKVKKS